MIDQYFYPKPSSRTERMDVNRLKPVKADEEVLLGHLRGIEATDIEERTGKALSFNKKPYSFQIDMPIEGSPDWKSIDFIVDNLWPLEVNGEIGHDTSAEQGKDLIREIQLNETFEKRGLMPMTVIWWYDLENQEQANNTIRDLNF